MEKGGDALVSDIKRTIEENGIADYDLEPGQAEELAAAVSAFLEEHELTDSFIDAGYLVMLASKAMSSIGQDRAALRLVVFGSGMVRPSEWEVTGGSEVWTLDLKQMTVADATSLELVVFNTLNIVLDSVTDVWDASNGNGVLGLRHVCDTAAGLLGVSRNSKAVADLSNEIVRVCGLKLEKVGRSRGWETCPQVMNLDL